jgi:steroid 5-alpha reductase family enzyme
VSDQRRRSKTLAATLSSWLNVINGLFMQPSNLFYTFAVQAVSLSAIMMFAWAVQQRTRNSGWIDAVWTFGLGAVGCVSALALHGPEEWPSGRQILVAAIVAIWALRLGTHIVKRSSSKADDPRYAELLRGWGTNARREMFLLLQKQALVSLPLAISILAAAYNPAPLWTPMDVLAIVVVVVAIVGEATADKQLAAFIAADQSRGYVCDAGLWKYSRHPNYFFEWLHWLAYPLLAVHLAGGYAFGWLALAGPLCMYWLLRYVSGVPPLEEHMLRRHGDAYRRYQSHTNAFFPGPQTDVR